MCVFLYEYVYEYVLHVFTQWCANELYQSDFNDWLSLRIAQFPAGIIATQVTPDSNHRARILHSTRRNREEEGMIAEAVVLCVICTKPCVICLLLREMCMHGIKLECFVVKRINMYCKLYIINI